MDGSDAASDNSVERNHGRAIRPYLSLNPQIKIKKSRMSSSGAIYENLCASNEPSGRRLLIVNRGN